VNEGRVHALIPAAGHSVRFGGTTLKQYAHLLGMPVMAHSISSLIRHKVVRSVTVALAEDDGIFNDLIRPNFPNVLTVNGGDYRAQSVLNGLQFISSRFPDCDWVLVHDAARPCLSINDLASLLERGLASESGPCWPCPSTTP
jgi:2-C-methyl-D-erythritol 4-phosphate cytidylyltransferase